MSRNVYNQLPVLEKKSMLPEAWPTMSSSPVGSHANAVGWLPLMPRTVEMRSNTSLRSSKVNTACSVRTAQMPVSKAVPQWTNSSVWW